MDDFNTKSLDYMAYLIARGHSAKLVKPEFNKVSEIPTHEGCNKVEKPFENSDIYINVQLKRSISISNHQSSYAFN